MEPREPYWSGYVEADGAVKPIEIYHDEGSEYVDIYIDDNLADDIENVDDLYGRFYLSLEDYRNDYDTFLTAEDVWPDVN